MPLAIKIIFIIISLLLVIFIFYPQKKLFNIPSKNKASAQNIDFAEISLNQNFGFKIHANSAELESENLLCKSLTCTVISNGKEIAHLNAQNSLINTKTKNLSFNKDIIGDFNDFKFEGQNFNYNNKNKILNSSKQFKVIHPRFNIKSNETTISIRDETIEFSGNVESNLN